MTEHAALELPALVVAGHVEDAITIELGYGRNTPALPVAHGIGANGYLLQRGPAEHARGVARRRLDDWRWADRARGLVRLPIEQAIDRYVAGHAADRAPR